MLNSQLKKKHLRGVRKFLEYKDIENAVNWIIGRLISNMRNVTTNENYRLYFSPSIVQLHENVKSDYNYEKDLELMQLEKFDKSIIRKGIQKIYDNLIFEENFYLDDINYLCEKFGFVIDDILKNNISKTLNFKKERQAESGNSQLVFVFESEYKETNNEL